MTKRKFDCHLVKVTSLTTTPPVNYKEGPTQKDIPNYVGFTVHVAFEMELGVHLRNCARCNAVTPVPTPQQLQEVGQYLLERDGRSMSVGDGDWQENEYMPIGWGYVSDKLLCGGCLSGVAQVLEAALKDPKPKVPAP